MNDAIEKCDPALMDRLYDDEVDAAERARAQAHLAGCPSCRRLREENRLVGNLFRSRLEGAITGADKTALEERVIAQIDRRNSNAWVRLRDYLTLKKLIPLAAVAGMLMLVFSYFFETEVPSGPSAIVTSFQGDYSSVMIVETPDTRNTIIWFVETT